MRRAVCMLTALAGSYVLATSFLASTAEAIPAFQTQFYKKYLTDNDDADYVNLVKKEAKCWLCHQGKSRKNHNAYGIHLTELLTKKDIKDVEKIQKALDKVGKMRSDPDDENSKTYAELIAASKLPGGSVEDCKKEPEEAEGGGNGDGKKDKKDEEKEE